MRCANEVADRLAKEAAESVRHDKVLLDWVAERVAQLKEVVMFVGKLTYEAGAHVLPDGQVTRDSEGLSTQFPVSGRRKVNGHVQRAAVRSVQSTVEGGGRAAPTAPPCNLEPVPRKRAQAGSRQVAPAVAKRRARRHAAKAEVERQEESAFQAWWRENRALRVSPAAVSSASSQDRLAAVRSRCLAAGTQ